MKPSYTTDVSSEVPNDHRYNLQLLRGKDTKIDASNPKVYEYEKLKGLTKHKNDVI